MPRRFKLAPVQWRFSRSGPDQPVRTGPARTAALASRARHGANRADIAEQILEEAAVAAQCRRLVAIGIDPHDLFHAAPFDAGDIARRIEVHLHDELGIGARPGERPLLGVDRHVVPGRLAELALERRLPQRLFHGKAVVHAGLHRIGQRGIDQIAAMVANARTSAGQHRKRHRRNAPHHQPIIAHSRTPLLDPGLRPGYGRHPVCLRARVPYIAQALGAKRRNRNGQRDATWPQAI
jgi:hypothetical protein